MHASCTCKHIRYSLWRLHVFQFLFLDVNISRTYPLPFLDSKRFSVKPHRRYHTNARINQKHENQSYDSKSARTPNSDLINGHDVDEWPSGAGDDNIRQENTGRRAAWSPMDKSGHADMDNLIASLKDLTEEAQLKQVDEDVPFQTFDSERLYTPTAKMRRFQDDNKSSFNNNSVQSLPKSPLWRRRRPQDRLIKKLPTAQDNRYLANNTWAQILGSPFRFCQGSRARVPVELFVDFSLVQNPKDGNTYLMPDELGNMEVFKETLPSDQVRRPKPQRKMASSGTTIRILPNELLLQSLSNQLSIWNPTSKTATTKKTAVAKRLLPRRWKDANDAAAAYRRASKEYFEVDNDQDGQSSQNLLDFDDVQWKADIAERILLLMRHRILLALDCVGTGVQARRKINRRQVMALRSPEAGFLQLSEGKLCEHVKTFTEEFWNDMGDIEEVNAVSGEPKPARDTKRPPIAVQPSEIKSSEDNILPENGEIVDWLAGSFFLSLGSSSGVNTRLEKDEPLGAIISSFEPLPESCYIPSMISVNDTHRLPVFQLENLLGLELQDTLLKVLAKHHVFSLSFWDDFNKSGAYRQPVSEAGKLDDSDVDGSYLILVKPSAPGSQILLREIWQLWRYMGGRSFQESDNQHINLSKSPKNAVLRLSQEGRQAMQSSLESMLFNNKPSLVVAT